MSLSFFLNAAKQTWDNDLSKKQKEIEKKLMHERERERERERDCKFQEFSSLRRCKFDK